MAVFNLDGVISLDSSGLNRGLADSESSMKSFGDKMSAGFDKVKKAAAVLVSGAIIKKVVDDVKALVTETAAAGDAIDKQSQALGLSRKAYQEWDYILSQNGASIDSLGASMRTLTNGITSGSKDTQDALRKIGLAGNELEGLTQEQAFEKVVKAFQKMPPSMNKTAIATKLLGRGAQDLMPLLNSSADSVDVLKKQAQDLGLIMSDDAVNASVAYTDALDTMQRTFNGLKYAVGAKVMPILTNAFKNIASYAGKLHKAYDKEGLSGVFKTLWKDIKNIKWPTWNDVKNAAMKAWEGIKSGVAALGGLIFGKDEKGEVKWPTWKDVERFAVRKWNEIKRGAAEIMRSAGKLIFGSDDNGEVKWPTWKDVQSFAIRKWNEIKRGAAEIMRIAGKLIFGEDDNGEVKWPTWKDVEKFAKEKWEQIKEGAATIAQTYGKIIFGEDDNGEVKWPTWGEVKDFAVEKWKDIKRGAAEIARIAGKLVFGEDDKGEVKWPTWEDVRKSATDWWKNDIKPNLAGILDFAIKLTGLDGLDEFLQKCRDAGAEIDTYIFKPIREFYNNEVKPIFDWIGQAIRDLASFFGIDAGERSANAERGQGIYNDLDELYKAGKIAEAKNKYGADIFDEFMKSKIAEFSGELDPAYLEEVYTKIGELAGGIDDTSASADAAAEAADKLKESILSVPTEHTTTFNAVMNGNYNDPFGLYGYNAKGLYNVPYNDYPSLLHEGEMVLTKSQAREYREGGKNANVNIGNLVPNIVGAIREGMRDAQVTAYMDGKRVTRETNRLAANKLKDVRFAT